MSDNPHASYAATVPGGASLSGPVDLGGRRLFGVQFPDLMDSTQVGFRVKVEGSSVYAPMYDEDGDEILLTVQTGNLVILDPIKFLAVSRFKIHCGTDGGDTPESDDRELILLAVD